MSFQRDCTNSLLRVCYANIDCTGVQKQECSLHGYASGRLSVSRWFIRRNLYTNPIRISNSPYTIQEIPLFPLPQFQNRIESRIKDTDINYNPFLLHVEITQSVTRKKQQGSTLLSHWFAVGRLLSGLSFRSKGAEKGEKRRTYPGRACVVNEGRE